ncbi:ceramide synthase 1-like isoform X2 [Lineus longissimus]|uniref:ceramide synthase 1-like isoform X2 n=1 Tax=Lineus longissimus TaxID=88925 RepID=UPI00315DB900
MPTYKQCILDTYSATVKFLDQSNGNYSYPFDFFRDLKKYGDFPTRDFAVVFGLAVFWTIARYLLTLFVYKPIGLFFNLTPLNQKKFPESAWKWMFYMFTWSYSIYILFFTDRRFFQQPLLVWQDWVPSLVMPFDIYLMYMIQCSFYIHSIYATLFMDQWRKDSIVMMFHHFLTLSLIGFSYAVRYHKVGALVLFVHDVTDICLEFTKCNVYLKDRGGRFYAFHDILSTIGFIFFASTWFIFRLYWFPLKVLHSAGHGAMTYAPSLPVFWFFFNVMLWILQILNIYWFMFIVNFLYKIATGQMKEVDDIRENEVDEKCKRVQHKPMNGFAGGHVTNHVGENNHVMNNHKKVENNQHTNSNNIIKHRKSTKTMENHVHG